MGVLLEALHRLQEIELQLTDLRQRLGSKQRSVRAHERRVSEIQQEVEKKRGATREKQIEADRYGLDIKASEERIAKLRVALNAAKTNKEYSALLSQLNTDKADTSKTEDRLLGLLSEIDAMRKGMAEDEECLRAEQSMVESLQRDATEYEAQQADRLKRLISERALAAEGIPPSALIAFERVAEHHEGEAMARVVQTNPRRQEFACSGCNMSVTLEQVNSIITRDDTMYCHTCGRILYLERSTGIAAR